MKLQILTFCAVLMSGFVAPPSAASPKSFATYEGPDAVRTGTGGSKLTKHGIDYWISGSPPRRYRLLGRLTDARYTAYHSDVAGSPSIAKRVKQLGGNAVVVIHRRSNSEGAIIGTGTGIFGGIDERELTELDVIRYEQDKPSD